MEKTVLQQKQKGVKDRRK